MLVTSEISSDLTLDEDFTVEKVALADYITRIYLQNQNVQFQQCPQLLIERWVPKRGYDVQKQSVIIP